MGGGILQLVMKGKMDHYLTGNPEFSFFKSVYRRHTNFSMESIKQQIENLGIGERKIKSKLSRAGDLIGKIIVEIKLNRGDAQNITGSGTYLNWTNNTGHALIKECSIDIGGHVIDKHYSDWLDVQNELYDINEQEWLGLNKHPGKVGYFKSGEKGIDSQVLKLYVPLHFWFCNNPGLYLPIVAITKHDINLNMVIRSVENLFNLDGELSYTNTSADIDIWCEYMFLDSEEKRKFLSEKRAYLIQQVQRHESDMKLINPFKFYHPVKEIVWIVQDQNVRVESGNGNSDMNCLLNVSGQAQTNKNDYFNYQSSTSLNSENIYAITSYESFKTAKLRLNGIDRFYDRDASYFRMVQPLHCKQKVPNKHIYLYSFSINPRKYQPSGCCNFSKVDEAELIVTSSYNYVNERLIIFAVNYNVLVVSSGMAGLVYK
tara:strand:+ start:1547 stop:2836 length:1290 start_codon:yes stop_codon:yes gene_type:complete